MSLKGCASAAQTGSPLWISSTAKARFGMDMGGYLHAHLLLGIWKHGSSVQYFIPFTFA
jgi:hypothetical protein